MGSKNKLKRFKENETFANVFQPTREELTNKEFNLKGNWNATFFKNNNPLALHNPETLFGGSEVGLTDYPEYNAS